MGQLTEEFSAPIALRLPKTSGSLVAIGKIEGFRALRSHEGQNRSAGSGFVRGGQVSLVPPLILQEHPDGAPEGYDGSANCGPTSMAMIARRLGRYRNLSDAELIMRFARLAETNFEIGTENRGIIALAAELDRPCASRKGGDLEWLRERLLAGNAVVVNGDYYAMSPHHSDTEYEGHYVLVYGLDRAGRFLVRDPYDGNVDAVSDKEMKQFFDRHEDGGWQLALDLASSTTAADRCVVPSISYRSTLRMTRQSSGLVLPAVGRSRTFR